jgi:hypothetical protein
LKNFKLFSVKQTNRPDESRDDKERGK